MMERDHGIRLWQLVALLAAAAAVAIATTASVQHERYTRARKLGVSVVALSNPERLMRRLRAAGGL